MATKQTKAPEPQPMAQTWNNSLLEISTIRADKELQAALAKSSNSTNPDVWNLEILKVLGVATVNLGKSQNDHWAKVDIERFPTAASALEYLRAVILNGEKASAPEPVEQADPKLVAFSNTLKNAVAAREADPKKWRAFFEAATGFQNTEAAWNAFESIDKLVAQIEMYEPDAAPVDDKQPEPEPEAVVTPSVQEPASEATNKTDVPDIVTAKPPTPDEEFVRYGDLIAKALDERIMPTNRQYQGYLLAMATGKKNRRELYDAQVPVAEVIEAIRTFDLDMLPTERRNFVDEIAPRQLLVREAVQVSRPVDNRYWLSDSWQPPPAAVADFVYQSGLYPTLTSRAAAMVLIFAGLEMGLTPFNACQQLVMIKGKVTISGQLMLAKLYQYGVRVEFLVRTGEVCTLKMTRPDGNSYTGSYTIEDAKKAGLLDKATWQQHTRAMLTWRAVSEIARIIASDILILGGIPQYSTEEMAPENIYDADGRVVKYQAA